MISTYYVKDDFLDDPHLIKDKSKLHKFYNKNNSPHNINAFPGERSDFFFNLDPLLQGYIFHKVTKIYREIFDIDVKNIVKDTHQFCFSKLIESSICQKHIDGVAKEDRDTADVLIAGVVYLNEQPEKDAGTALYIDNKEVKIDNVFNRLIVYDSDIVHKPIKGFGKTYDDDCRLTLNIFSYFKLK